MLVALAACGAVPQSRGEAPRPVTTAQPVAVNAENRRCLTSLEQTQAKFSALPDRVLAPGCRQFGTVQLSSLRGDTRAFSIANIGPVECPTAQTFANWARFGADRAARQILGSGIARIETMGSYACRNVSGSSRRSAHARSAAIDIGGFVLEDGRRISLRDDWNGGTRAERQFLRTVHRSACKRFGTVLGPDYNQAHADHFHLELGGREGQRNFCR